MITKQPRLSNGNFAGIDINVRLKRNSQELPNGCVQWLLYKDPNGYGSVAYNGRPVKTHRVAYELKYGKVPKGLVLDHLCRNRGCINPDHLEAVTQKENILRGEQPRLLSEKYKNQFKCVNGHILDNNRYEYSRIDKSNGKTYVQRKCKSCRKEEYIRRKNVRTKK